MMGRGSAEPSLGEIHQDMSELLDKQVSAQKEKNFGDSRKLPQAHEKVCDEMKQRKNDACKNAIKLRKEALYNACTKYW